MSYDVIQGQGHENLKVGNSLIFKNLVEESTVRPTQCTHGWFIYLLEIQP